MTLTDKSGAPVTVTKLADRFTVGVDGKSVGLTAYREHGGQRVFHHTEVDEDFGVTWAGNGAHRAGADRDARGWSADCAGMSDGARLRA